MEGSGAGCKAKNDNLDISFEPYNCLYVGYNYDKSKANLLSSDSPSTSVRSASVALARGE